MLILNHHTNLQAQIQVLTQWCQIQSQDRRWYGCASMQDTGQQVVVKQQSTLSLQHSTTQVVNGLDRNFLYHHQMPYNTIMDIWQKGGEKAHEMTVCNLATVFPSGPIFSSRISSHSSNCGSMSIKSSCMEALGTIFQSIAPGSWFAVIADSVIFWRMSVDRPVVKKSMISVLVTRELLKLTTLLLPFFELHHLLMDFRSRHNFLLLVRSPQSHASEGSYSWGRAFFASLKSTARHGGCE